VDTVINFCKPFLGKKEEQAVVDVLRGGWFAAGEKTAQFENEFAKYVGVKYAIFTNSGTAALKMAYKYMKEENETDLLIIPKNTYSATYAAAVEMGLEYEFGDDYISSGSLANKYNNHRQNIVLVHYGGVKTEDGRAFLEDSAHRIEANDPLIGKIRIYSFYVTKNMTTGAGGMLVTDDKEIYERCRLYWRDGINKSTYDRQHGGWDYTVETMAGGYDGNDMAAAIGIEQLKKLPQMTKDRNRIRDTYNKSFRADWKGNHLYPYFVNNTDEVAELIEYLKKGGVQASYHYPKTGWLGVSLPIYPSLTKEEQTTIINMVLTWQADKY
jgi:dTDP-4-amino-4,6-dideoxygalactose transaminase